MERETKDERRSPSGRSPVGNSSDQDIFGSPAIGQDLERGDQSSRSVASPSRARGVFNVEQAEVVVPRATEEPVRSSTGRGGSTYSLKRRGDRSFSKHKVDFRDSVVDLRTGEVHPLRHEGSEQVLRRAFHPGAVKKGSMEASIWKYNSPIGHRMLENLVHGGKGLSLNANRMLVLVLTFLCYTAYHASRKPPSIVKSVLHGEGNGVDMMQTVGGHRSLLEVIGDSFMEENNKHNDTATAGWAPFNNPKTGKALLGDLDLAFLGAYASACMPQTNCHGNLFCLGCINC